MRNYYKLINYLFRLLLPRMRRSEGLPTVRGKFSPQDVGNLGIVIHETSRYLAKQYGLSKDAVANGLPLIDTTKTIIETYCPPFLMTPKCEVRKA